jgi:hypothetical protein
MMPLPSDAAITSVPRGVGVLVADGVAVEVVLGVCDAVAVGTGVAVVADGRPPDPPLHASKTPNDNAMSE